MSFSNFSRLFFNSSLPPRIAKVANTLLAVSTYYLVDISSNEYADTISLFHMVNTFDCAQLYSREMGRSEGAVVCICLRRLISLVLQQYQLLPW